MPSLQKGGANAPAPDPASAALLAAQSAQFQIGRRLTFSALGALDFVFNGLREDPDAKRDGAALPHDQLQFIRDFSAALAYKEKRWGNASQASGREAAYSNPPVSSHSAMLVPTRENVIRVVRRLRDCAVTLAEKKAERCIARNRELMQSRVSPLQTVRKKMSWLSSPQPSPKPRAKAKSKAKAKAKARAKSRSRAAPPPSKPSLMNIYACPLSFDRVASTQDEPVDGPSTTLKIKYVGQKRPDVQRVQTTEVGGMLYVPIHGAVVAISA